MGAKANNVNMFQLSTRDIDEDEPLTMLNIKGVHIWLDADENPVIVDLPTDFCRLDYVK